MTPLFRRLLAALTLTASSAEALAQTPGPADAPPAPASVRSLDLGAAATAPLITGLAQDLGPLLNAAWYGRAKGNPESPNNSLTSVRRLADALRTHPGVAYVALAERAGEAVELRALYVLEGAPAGATIDAARAAANNAGKAAVAMDLAGESARALLASLQVHLGALLPPAGTGSASTREEVVEALQGHQTLAYVVLAERAGEAKVGRSRVFVVPDVLRISIQDEATGAPGGDRAHRATAPSAGDGPAEAPEVELVADPEGGPPLIKFEFDPAKYDITNNP